MSRSGVRVRRGSLVVHVLRRPDVPEFDGIGSDVGGARAGLVVGRGVGNSVVRHRVSRRLRAQLALVLDDLPADWEVVVRATPDAATALSAALRSDLRGALDTARRKLPAVGGVRV